MGFPKTYVLTFKAGERIECPANTLEDAIDAGKARTGLELDTVAFNGRDMWTAKKGFLAAAESLTGDDRRPAE